MSFDDDIDTCSILVPTAITPAMISSTTVSPEDPNPAWASGTTYAAGARVYSATTHRVYESLKAGNVGNDPTVPANQMNIQGVGTWWIDAGPTNKYAMFDGVVSSQSAIATPMTVVLAPGRFNRIALFGIDADTISITVKDAPGGVVIYSYTGALEGSAPSDYYEYLFEPFKPQTQFISGPIEPYGAAELTLTLSKGSGTVKLGMLALGDLMPVGAPLRGASVEPVDYSSIITDAYGNTTIKKRVNATGMSITARCGIHEANQVLAGIKSVLGTPVVVIGSEEALYEALTVFGLVSARGNYNQHGDVDIAITVKGMI